MPLISTLFNLYPCFYIHLICGSFWSKSCKIITLSWQCHIISVNVALSVFMTRWSCGSVSTDSFWASFKSPELHSELPLPKKPKIVTLTSGNNTFYADIDNNSSWWNGTVRKDTSLGFEYFTQCDIQYLQGTVGTALKEDDLFWIQSMDGCFLMLHNVLKYRLVCEILWVILLHVLNKLKFGRAVLSENGITI